MKEEPKGCVKALQVAKNKVLDLLASRFLPIVVHQVKDSGQKDLKGLYLEMYTLLLLMKLSLGAKKS